MKKFEYPIIYSILIVGVLLIGFSIYLFSKTWIFKNKAIKTTGKIIDVESRLGGKNKTREYAAVIAFTTSEGKMMKFQSKNYTLASPVIGQDINVYYTIDPLYAVEEKFTSMWGIPFGLLLLGGFFIVFSIIYYRKGSL